MCLQWNKNHWPVKSNVLSAKSVLSACSQALRGEGLLKGRKGTVNQSLECKCGFTGKFTPCVKKKSQNPLNVTICVFTDDRDIPYPENKFRAMICFDLLQLKILIFFSCVWHEFTHEARESSLASGVFCLHFSSSLLASPSAWKRSFSFTSSRFLGCCKMTFCLWYLQRFPTSWLLQWFKKILHPWGSSPWRETLTEEQGFADLLLSVGGDALIFQQLPVQSENHLFFSHFLTRERAVCLPGDTLEIVRIVQAFAIVQQFCN